MAPPYPSFYACGFGIIQCEKCIERVKDEYFFFFFFFSFWRFVLQIWCSSEGVSSAEVSAFALSEWMAKGCIRRKSQKYGCRSSNCPHRWEMRGGILADLGLGQQVDRLQISRSFSSPLSLVEVPFHKPNWWSLSSSPGWLMPLAWVLQQEWHLMWHVR